MVTATMPFWDLGHPLWEADDARYAEVPREMAESGDWLTPTLNYMDYIQKPPLIYWMTAASYTLFGVSEASARLPLALLSLLGLAGAAWLGSWLYSPRVGLAAAVMLGTCLQYRVLSHLITPDMALSVFLLWTSALILRGLRHPSDAAWAGPAAGAAMGLAFLSKGLVGVLFPAAWACSLLILFPPLRRGARVLAYALPLLAAVVVPWVAAMAQRHPNFIRHFFLEHHFQRFLTPEFNRPGAWYYFLGVDLAGLLPWTPVAVAAALAAGLSWRKGPGRRDDPGLQLLLWAAGILIFFSASRSKLLTYLLPIFPHQCLMAAAWLDRAAPDRWKVLLGRAGAGLGALCAVASPFWPVLAPRLLPGAGGALAWTGAAALLALGAALWAGSRGSLERALRAAAPAWAVTACGLLAMRAAGAALSAKEVAQRIESRWRPGDRLITYDFYLHGLSFYLRRPVDVIVNWRGELRVNEGDPRYQERFGNDVTVWLLAPQGRAVFFVVRNRARADFETCLRFAQGPIRPKVVREKSDYGAYSLYVVSDSTKDPRG